MPSGYHHLTQSSRCQIYALKSTGLTQRAMAKHLGCSESTISREIRRNSGQRGYRLRQAERLAQNRRHQASCQPKVMTQNTLKRITDCLAQEWSPEQISGRLRSEGIVVSHETIYQYIWRDKRQGGNLYQHLRHHGKKYNKRSGKTAGRGCIPNRVDIEKRPAIVEQKSRIGDWEGDLIIGAKHQGGATGMVYF